MGPEEEKGGGEREGKEESHQRRRESDATYWTWYPHFSTYEVCLATFCQVLQMDPPRLAQGHTSINS